MFMKSTRTINHRQLGQPGPPAAGGAPNPLLHVYYWLRWQTFGTVLPDEGQEGSR
jgi:hypothetical protein